MADNSLDDFFAKKDKSKKKSSKSKMTPTDVLGKADEGPKKVKKKKDKEQPGGLGLNSVEEETAKKQAEDDEWTDFAEQKEVDYTGLRIQTLQFRQEEDRETGESEGEGEGGDGDGGRDSASGPWNASSGQTSAVQTSGAASAPEPEEKKETTAPKKYVPPAQRAGAQGSGGSGKKVGKKSAPNIQSEEDFPTLGGGPQPSSGTAWGAKKYESSVASDIDTNPAQRRGVNLSLENKFAALQD